MDLAAVTVETFEPLVGDTFTIAATPQELELVLESALAVGEWPGGRQPFSLMFRGPREPLLPQSIYALEHPGAGVLEIFIVPAGQDAGGTSYQAIST